MCQGSLLLTPEALCGMMTHKPTPDDYKYFVNAPTLPSSPRRALLHVHSRTAGIKKPLRQARQEGERERESASDGAVDGSPRPADTST